MFRRDRIHGSNFASKIGSIMFRVRFYDPHLQIKHCYIAAYHVKKIAHVPGGRKS